MTVKLEIYYSFQSPYSYLALDSIYALEDTYDVELLWQPFSAKASGQTIQPTPVNPDKLSYLFEDCKRIAAEANIPLMFPEGWPEAEFDPGRIVRGALYATDTEMLKEYNYKVFHKCWGLGENPNEEVFLTELCEELDIDLGEFLSKISSSDTRERVKGVYKRCKSLGVYDTPAILIDTERFVGFDKIAAVATRLEKMGAKKKIKG